MLGGRASRINSICTVGIPYSYTFPFQRRRKKRLSASLFFKRSEFLFDTATKPIIDTGKNPIRVCLLIRFVSCRVCHLIRFVSCRVCRLIRFVSCRVCRLKMFVAYRVCRLLCIGYVDYGLCRSAFSSSLNFFLHFTKIHQNNQLDYCSALIKTF